jgi:hypothetical protein
MLGRVTTKLPARRWAFGWLAVAAVAAVALAAILFAVSFSAAHGSSSSEASTRPVTSLGGGYGRMQTVPSLRQLGAIPALPAKKKREPAGGVPSPTPAPVPAQPGGTPSTPTPTPAPAPTPAPGGHPSPGPGNPGSGCVGGDFC